jgi:hypothetical protein
MMVRPQLEFLLRTSGGRQTDDAFCHFSPEVFGSGSTRRLSFTVPEPTPAAFLHLSFLTLYKLLGLASGGPTNTYGSTRWEFRTDGATRSELDGSLEYDDTRRRAKENMSRFAPMKLSTNLSKNHRKGGCLSYATPSLHFCAVSRHRLFRLKYQIENKNIQV